MKIINWYRNVLEFIGKLELLICLLLLSSIVLLILSQVFSRYFLGQPIIFVEELATYALIWLGLTSASLAYKYNRHITIRTYEKHASDTVKKIMSFSINLVVLSVMSILIQNIPNAMKTEMMQQSVGLPINIHLHWFFSVPLLICFCSIAFTSLLYAIESLIGLPKPILISSEDPSLADDIGL